MIVGLLTSNSSSLRISNSSFKTDLNVVLLFDFFIMSLAFVSELVIFDEMITHVTASVSKHGALCC